MNIVIPFDCVRQSEVMAVIWKSSYLMNDFNYKNNDQLNTQRKKLIKKKTKKHTHLCTILWNKFETMRFSKWAHSKRKHVCACLRKPILAIARRKSIFGLHRHGNQRQVLCSRTFNDFQVGNMIHLELVFGATNLKCIIYSNRTTGYTICVIENGVYMKNWWLLNFVDYLIRLSIYIYLNSIERNIIIQNDTMFTKKREKQNEFKANFFFVASPSFNW